MHVAPSPVSIRTVTERDVPALVALTRAAYPDLAEQEVVFTKAQLLAHTHVFPRGQQVAERNGVVVGAIATLILPKGMNPLVSHTWSEATGDGYFTDHDREGDTLYLADIYVDVAAWGQGVGAALYASLRDVARELGLARVVAGGRLWGYHAVAYTMPPEQYVSEVIRGERSDKVLGSQLKAGFVVRGILPSYLPDPKSCGFASLLEWTNPDVPREAGARRRPRTEAALLAMSDNYLCR